MEKSKSLRVMVYILMGIGVFQLGILGFTLRSGGFFFWMILLTLLIVCVYLGVICLKLIGLAREHIDKPDGR